jgi:hypothetical protein
LQRIFEAIAEDFEAGARVHDSTAGSMEQD